MHDLTLPLLEFRMRFSGTANYVATPDVMHKYGPDYKPIFVGDAAMSPYEITHAGGSLEYSNAKAGTLAAQDAGDLAGGRLA
jgi:uncharacterized protein with von Willebrand factor type A (vWA) domain